MKPIRKNIISTKIYPYFVKIGEDKIPTVVRLDPVTRLGKLSTAQAHKVAKEAYPEIGNVAVSAVETTEELYEMSAEAFVANATKINTEKENVNNE